MSGPDYPRTPPPLEPISRAPRLDVWDTVESQYANSPVLTTIIKMMAEHIDPGRNLQAFFDDIWNLDTARGHGLDVWGRIVGVSRALRVSSDDWFGFESGLPDSALFGGEGDGGPFYSGVDGSQIYYVSDNIYRLLIIAKAFANIRSSSIKDLNTILMILFGHKGNAYVVEGYDGEPYFGFAEAHDAEGFASGVVGFSPEEFNASDFYTKPDAGAPFYSGQEIDVMKIQYVLEFEPDVTDLAIIDQSGVLPKPIGIRTSISVKATP